MPERDRVFWFKVDIDFIDVIRDIIDSRYGAISDIIACMRQIKRLAGIIVVVLAGLLVMRSFLKHRPGPEWNSYHDVSGFDASGWMPQGG